MISIKFDDKNFFKDLTNIAKYSEGFLEGAELGKNKLAKSLAENGIDIFKAFVDQNARVDQNSYHHIYEWYQIGNPEGRLFDISYSVNDGYIFFNSTFLQSNTVKQNSNTPFFNKAEIMERGLPVTIAPVNSSVLTFEINGNQVFTSNPITIEHPGGLHVMGTYERIFDMFFKEHFYESVLASTGISSYLKDIKTYKDNLKSGKISGRSKGIEVGYNWITRAGDINV